MSRPKKTNLISLSNYRAKKQKLISEKAGKAVSGDNSLSVNDPKASGKDSQLSKIYYMKNYLKSKRLPPLNDQESSETKSGATAQVYEKHKEQSNLISLSDYRKRKQDEKKAWLHYPKQAVQVAALSLMMLFVFNIFFQEESNRSIASQTELVYLEPEEKKKKEIEKQKDYITRIQNIDPKEQKVILGRRPASSEYKGF